MLYDSAAYNLHKGDVLRFSFQPERFQMRILNLMHELCYAYRNFNLHLPISDMVHAKLPRCIFKIVCTSCSFADIHMCTIMFCLHTFHPTFFFFNLHSSTISISVLKMLTSTSISTAILFVHLYSSPAKPFSKKSVVFLRISTILLTLNDDACLLIFIKVQSDVGCVIRFHFSQRTFLCGSGHLIE